MDLVATSAVAWWVLGTVVGILLAGLAVFAAVGLRSGTPRGPAQSAEQSAAPASTVSTAGGWSVDDLPGFLADPPGIRPAAPAPLGEVRLGGGPPLLDAPRFPAPPAPPAVRASTGVDRGPRLLLALSGAALLLVGAAAAVAAATAGSRGVTEPPLPRTPSWAAPDMSGVPASPSPGDPGAGRLAAASVPVGPEGAVARAAFEGLVLERRAVGVTVAYPAVSVTSSDVASGPALAHLVLPVWNCLGDAAPADPEAAGCRRLPTEHAELGTPALSVLSEGEALRISGRFPTYVRPTGSPPGWTGRVYPLTVTWTPEGSTLHLGTERAAALDGRGLTELRLGR